MSHPRATFRRFRMRAAALGAALTAFVVYAVLAGAAPVIPVPDPLVVVTTKSGTVTKTHHVPIGGAPVPIDVDGPNLLGILEPDIDVSVGLVVLDELPEKPIVPNVVVRRNALALTTGRPAPPLDFDAKVVLRDAGNMLEQIVEVHYGFVTPQNARIPPLLTAKLVGPIEGGFTDPLQAKIEAPGYSGPLNLRISALTDELDANFRLAFDSLPESIFVSEDPREDGLDVLYTHNAPVTDVNLDAFATLRNRQTNELLEIAAGVDRLPQRIELHNTNTPETTTVEYESSSALNKPDLTAIYRDYDGDGRVITDADLDVGGLPHHIVGKINTIPPATPDGQTEIDKVDFKVLDGEEIDVVDFLAQNFTGTVDEIPVVNALPDQHVQVATRLLDDGSTRWRAAGRVFGIRELVYERLGDDNKTVDATTDMGDGVKSLRAILDLDSRGPGAPADASRTFVDTTITPLPREIHALFEPSRSPTQPTHLLYQSSNTLAVDANVVLAAGSEDGCGEPKVTCAVARMDKVPTELDLTLPGEDGTDFNISHDGADGTGEPDIRATVDRTDADSKRVYANVQILRVPNFMTGRLDSADGVLRAAEFHACQFDFSDRSCETPQEAIGRVNFTVRDRPERGSLPPRPDLEKTFVSIIKRDARFEATGTVEEIRNVEFRQRDVDPDTLGALVDVGSAKAFDAYVDLFDTALNETTNAKIHVAKLPDLFTACVRKTLEGTVAALPADTLLTPCETDVISARDDEPVVVPLTAIYTASDDTDVTADVTIKKPDADDGNRLATQKVHTEILPLPAELRADVISPIAPEAGVDPRRMQLRYSSSSDVTKVIFGFESRRNSDICEDPRPNRKALCVEGTLHNLPDFLNVIFDPDESKGDIDFTSTAPDSGKLSVDPLLLTKVSPGAKDQPLKLSGKILGLTTHMTGKFVSLHTPQDPPDEKSLAAASFDACPDDDPEDPDDCGGIDLIDVTATNALVGDPIPAAPPKDPDTTQDFTFVQRALDFRADVEISKLKEVSLSKLDGAGAPGPTTKVRAAFGDGTSNEKLRAYIDRLTVQDPDTNSGLEEQIVHAVISEAPEAINICYRDKLDPPAVPAPSNSDTADYCDKAQADKLAVQSRLDVPDDTGAKPDIDIRRLRLAKGGGTDFLEGTAFIRNLAERIDVLAGKGEDTDILIEGHELDDGPLDPPVNVADRVKFNFRNYVGDDTGTGQFPFVSLNGAIDPQDDPRVDVSGGEENFAKVVKDVNDMLLKGSIPDIKRIALRPGPCDATDTVRFPAVGTYADPTQAPEYTCVNLWAAQNQPLGLAIRTKDTKGEILSMDEGFISSIPGGAGGIFATLGKAPDEAKLNPVCGVGGASGAQNCRPPLLSVKAPKAAGQTSNLQMRMAIGELGLVNQLKDVTPLDVYSQRLNYEQSVKDYTVDPPGDAAGAKGVRLKLGTGDVGTAVRLGANIDLPNFFDMDPPTSYTCKRDDLAGGPLDPDSAACKQSDVSSNDNNGFESKDISIRVVGANNEPLGTDLPSLGRAAVFVHSFDDSKQTLITGAFPANPADSGRVNDDPTGGAPETPYTEGPWDLGVDLPGHLDARIFIRNKFEAPGEEDTQTTYYQVDGRVNSPLSMTLRDVQSPALDGKTLLTGQTRDGRAVSALNLALRNAAGLGNGVSNFDKPTFRLRAEMRKKHKEPDEGPYACEGFNAGGDRTAGFGANFCIYVPGDHIEKWLDVGLNMNPDESSAPARTVDVVMDSKDYTQIDMRSWASVNGSGDPEAEGISKGAGAEFTPQAGLRLQPFPIGLEIGLGLGIVGGNTLLLLDGDLILKLTGREIDRLRLSQNKGALRILAEDGDGGDDDAYIKTHDLTRAIVQVRAEALFGLISENVVDVKTDPYHQPVEFGKCFPNLGLILPDDDYFEVTSNDSTKVAISFEPGNIPAEAAAAEVLTAASKLLAPIWCLFSTDDNKLVNNSHPAPAFDEPGRPITDQSFQPPEENPPATPTQQPEDLTVANGETVTLCGSQGFKTLTVQNGGVLRAGAQGTNITEILDLDGPGGEPPQTIVTPCDGSLRITADQVIVDGGGLIHADFVRTTLTPGGGTGGGAGHAGNGGPSGVSGPGGTPTAIPSGGPIADFGFRGRDGVNGGVGGNGGGTIVIDATNYISVAGVIRANGQAGFGATGVCDGAPDDVGGGGGSGGHVALTANVVSVAGDVEARGGAGDGGGHGGGGGSGGRITVNTVDPRPADADLEINAGTGGTAGTDCNPGGTGATGTRHGQTLNFAGGVTFDTAEDVPPTYVESEVPLKVRAVDNASGRLRVIVCRSSVPLTDPDGLNAAVLDPSGSSFSQLVSNADECQTRFFADATTAPNLYEQSFDFDVSDGFHGFFAFAARPHALDGGGEDCDPTDFDLTPCTYQSIIAGGSGPALPGISTVKVGADDTAPSLAFSNQSGTACGQDPRLCIAQSGKMSVQSVENTGGIGLSGVVCSLNGGPYDIPCGPGDGITIDFGTLEGPVDVSIKTTDQLGNERIIAGPKWFVDRDAGGVPEITKVETDLTETNGWRQSKPLISVHAEDELVGFTDNAVTFFTDTSSHACGTVTNVDKTFGPITISLPLEIDCSSAQTAPFVPEEGIHSFQAQTTDRLGNISLKSEIVTMKVDKTAPDVFSFIGPKAPDGENDWYVTKPFVAFKAVDNVGGSGVNRFKAPSKIEFNLDGAGWETYNPSFAPVLDDGVHDICFRATDVAGNTSDGTTCRNNIKVDTTAPDVADPIVPVNPNGDASWYTVTPTSDGTAADPHAAGVNTVSGLDRVEMSLDDGDWFTALPTDIPEGIHHMRTRAFDSAGNPSVLLEREIRVDKSDPSARLETFPPRPNVHGWYGRTTVTALAINDGRDGSGAFGAITNLDGLGFTDYVGPFPLANGNHSYAFRAKDKAGRLGTPNLAALPVDLTAPVGLPEGKTKNILIQLLGIPTSTTLGFKATDNLTPRVRVRVFVYNELGTLIRRLDAGGQHPGGYRNQGSGGVVWDGKDSAGRGALPGVYHYRVHVVDQAGNTVLGEESKPFLVVQGILPR